MFTLHIEQEDETIKQVEVSEEFMEMLFTSAKHICDKITLETTRADVISMIEEVTKDYDQRNIIFDMVEKIMLNRINKVVMESILEKLMGA